MDCGAVLQADNGHDLCPTCLGRDHLVEVLSENPCMNCSFMPRASRVARLAQWCPQDDVDLLPSGQVALLRRSKRRGETGGTQERCHVSPQTAECWLPCTSQSRHAWTVCQQLNPLLLL
ncbi:hypothetical protein ILYODFUR_014929 [Ilyodon furcidens]|uniref:Uncharacterized protein n=1 Tax=Ilyodon furcidens TaxID=33524 RepID=A0ABV0UGC9_9TELE